MSSPTWMPVCGSCGVIAPRQQKACEICRAEFATRPVSAPRCDDYRYWVGVRCTFLCRSCGFAAPLDQLDVDGAVECAYCGLRQRFEPSTWTEALEFAHAVGDLSGPESEGRVPSPSVWIGADNPFRHLGENTAFLALSDAQNAPKDERGAKRARKAQAPPSLSIQAAPGFPVCRRCKVPLQVTPRADGRTQTSCTSCQATSTYVLPAQAQSLGSSVMAVVAEEHRENRVHATESSDDGRAVSAVCCPSCGAPLTLQGSDRTIQCQFCSTFCRVPGRFLVRQGQGTIDPEIWWMLFRGPSPKRRWLESGKGTSAQNIELPPFEQRLNYKQGLINLAFVLGALWIGFELAALDVFHGFTLPDEIPTIAPGKPGPTPKSSPSPIARPHH